MSLYTRPPPAPSAADRRAFSWVRALPGGFLLMLAITAALDAVSLAFAFAVAHRHGLSLTAVLFPNLRRFLDLTVFYRRIGGYGTSAFFAPQPAGDLFNYPALMAYPVHWLFATHTPLQRYVGCMAAWLAVTMVLSIRALRRRGIPVYAGLAVTAALLLLNFPLQLLWFTSNVELFVWIALATGVWAYCCGRQWLAAACFGIAGALKYFPLALMGLFPVRRDGTKIAFGLTVCALANLLGLALMGPTVTQAAAGLRTNARAFAGDYLLLYRPVDSYFDHSLYGLLKSLLVLLGGRSLLGHMLPWYLGLLVPVLLLLYLFRIQHLPLVQRVLALSVIGVWVMPISQEYTLVHLLAPLTVLLLTAWDTSHGTLKQLSPAALVAFVCLGILFGALTFLRVGNAGVGAPVRSVVLGVLLLCSLQRRFLPGSLYFPPE